MVDFRDEVQDRKNWFESITAKLPLYKGYKEKELRREADRLLRDHLAAQFGEQLRQAESVTGQMLIGPGLAQLGEMGQGNTRLQTLIDKIKTAAQGYAGLFDAVKIKEDELDTLYEFDRNMLFKVDEVSEALTKLQAALDAGDATQMAPAVRFYVKTVTDAALLFDRRKDAMLGMAYR